MNQPALPSVDVILPFHRNDHFLRMSVESILASSGVKIRLIAIDDRPCGENIKWLENVGAEIIRAGGVGYSSALNLGKKFLQSDFVAFQDSDDISHPERLSLSISKIITEGSDICWSFMLAIDENSSPRALQSPRFRKLENFSASLLLGSSNSNSTWVMRTELLHNQDVFPICYASIDWATSLLNVKNFKYSNVNKYLYFYRSHSEQMTKSSEYKIEAFKQLYPLWQKLSDSYNLPHLDIQLASGVAAPWNLYSDWGIQSDKWVRTFFKKSLIHGFKDRNSAKILILFRKLKLRAYKLYSLPAILVLLSLIIRMLFEYPIVDIFQSRIFLRRFLRRNQFI